MKKYDLLTNLSFGAVDSESEKDLDKVFIQTENFKEFLNPNIALLLGSKGAGKSALFRLFAKYEASARCMSAHAIDDVYIVAGIGFKDVPEMDDMQLFNQIDSKAVSAETAWKIYITYKIIFELYAKYEIICGKKCLSVLQKSNVVRDNRILGLFTQLYKKFVGDPPKISQIDFKNVSISLSQNSKVSIYELLDEINAYLLHNKKTVWLLLDKIDELFSSKAETRKECIEGLFLAYIDFVARYSSIKVKIFLRTDIWNTLSFVNKSHLTDKTAKIIWNTESLTELILKRAVANKVVNDYIMSTTHLQSWKDDANRCFSLLFPDKVYPGPREAKTISWIIERSTDGLGGVYPREIINFCNFSVKEELKKGENLSQDMDPTKSAISGTSIRNAFISVSDTKVHSYLSEFINLSKHFERFTGQTSAEFTQIGLAELMKGLHPEGEEMIKQLHETGVIAYTSGLVLIPDSKIIVPRLFRSGLGIITQGRP